MTVRNSPPPGARIVGTFYGGKPMRWIVDINSDWLQPKGTSRQSKQHFPIFHESHEGPGALCSQAFMKLDPTRNSGPNGYCMTCVDMLINHDEYKENPIVPTTADILRQQMSALAAEVARLEALPKEPPPDEAGDGPVIFFEKRFDDSPHRAYQGTTYTYSAVKAGDGLWYTTGPRSPKGYTWQQLIEWIVSDESEQPKVWLATDFVEL